MVVPNGSRLACLMHGIPMHPLLQRKGGRDSDVCSGDLQAVIMMVSFRSKYIIRASPGARGIRIAIPLRGIPAL